MSIKTERIIGKKIICEIDSTTLRKAEYDTSSRKLLVTFKGKTYHTQFLPSFEWQNHKVVSLIKKLLENSLITK
jgi:hypothetical protein